MMGQVIAKADGNTGDLKESYVYANGEKLLTKTYTYDDAGTTTVKREYGFTDVQGSLIMTADALTGEVTSRTKYDPYGEVIWSMQKGLRETEYSYTGKEKDPTIGLTYFGARWYDGDAGRFVSTDPVSIKIEEPININKYQYCADNPIKYVDPLGKMYTSVLINIGADLYRDPATFDPTGIIRKKRQNRKKLLDLFKNGIDKELAEKIISQIQVLQTQVLDGDISINEAGFKLIEILSQVEAFAYAYKVSTEVAGYSYYFKEAAASGEESGKRIRIGLTPSRPSEDAPATFLFVTASSLFHEAFESAFIALFPEEIKEFKEGYGKNSIHPYLSGKRSLAHFCGMKAQSIIEDSFGMKTRPIKHGAVPYHWESWDQLLEMRSFEQVATIYWNYFFYGGE